ncbi:c-type cytochrome biogenesis protein CcmI [Psychromonas sp. KJ10-10]|uniref:c-type cytochrome biogenesis protein CcmI n=1 Tax=Psychromonas sp. KJ10-10 TaxID=3391823 RepID=UPI0039B5D28D
MVIQFWLGAILLLIIASALFVIPFLTTKKRNISNDNNRNQLNRALYDVRINELEKDDEQGLLIDKEKIISELQHNLLDDINDQQQASTSHGNKLLWLPGLLLLTLGSLLTYWQIGAYQEVSKWEDSLQRYPALQEQLFSNSGNRPTEQDLRDIMLGLRTRLANDPSDADGWLLYSRLGMVFKDNELALDAITKAYQLNPSSVDILLVFAQLKMQTGDESSQQQAELMLEKLLIEKPTELQAWSMYAFMALERQDYPAAIKRWQQMLTLVDVSSEQAGMLRDSISYAEKQMQGQSVAVNSAESEKVATVSQENTDSPIYSVDVSVAEQVEIPESGFIIVYAQAVSGPQMPIARHKNGPN